MNGNTPTASQVRSTAQPEANPLPQRLIEFVTALRDHGVSTGTGETVDAAAAIAVLGLGDRERLRHALAATLLRRAGHRGVFDALFDLYFPRAVGAPGAAPNGSSDQPRGLMTQDERRQRELDIAAMREELLAALAENDAQELLRLAAVAVERLGKGVGAGGGVGFSALQTLDLLQPETLIARLHAAMTAAAEEGAFTARLDRDEARLRVDRFRDLVRSEANRRAAEVRGRDRLARQAVSGPAERTDFLSANRKQLTELRTTIRPLSRKLATRLAARRRRASRGSIDIRRTVRRSLSTGGVPMRPAHRRHKPGRPDLVLLCDLSGSMAGFAQFTLLLVQALKDQFSRVRAFAFINATDEVTHLLVTGEADPGALAERIIREADVDTWSGHSDYGRALGGFAEDHLDAIGHRTCVLILGDARTNGSDPNAEALRRIVGRARAAHWLNPEPRAYWATGDSATEAYRPIVPMHECRNAAQLTEVISRLLPV